MSKHNPAYEALFQRSYAAFLLGEQDGMYAAEKNNGYRYEDRVHSLDHEVRASYHHGWWYGRNKHLPLWQVPLFHSGVRL